MKIPTILETRIVPPVKLLEKFRFYSSQYGVIHAVCSYFGRYCFPIWRLMGPIVNRKKLQAIIDEGIDVLNLGGGGNTNTRYLTADIDPRADVYVDLTRPLPMKTGSTNAIFLEEVIEHISKDQGIELFKECHRILKPGGCIRIITPNIAHFARQVLDSGDVRDINDLFYGHGHKYIYSSEELRSILANFGLTSINISQFQDPNSKLGYLDSHPYRFNHSPEISIYLEAVKASTL
jgi:predicted SAM-dependent methyltransferase